MTKLSLPFIILLYLLSLSLHAEDFESTENIENYLSKYATAEILISNIPKNENRRQQQLSEVKSLTNYLEIRLGKSRLVPLITANPQFYTKLKWENIAGVFEFLDFLYASEEKTNQYFLNYSNSFYLPTDSENLRATYDIFNRFVVDNRSLASVITKGFTRFRKIDANILESFLGLLKLPLYNFSDSQIENLILRGMTGFSHLHILHFINNFITLRKFVSLTAAQKIVIKGFSKFIDINPTKFINFTNDLQREPLFLSKIKIGILLKNGMTGFVYSKDRNPILLIKYFRRYIRSSSSNYQEIAMKGFSGFSRSSVAEVKAIINFLQGAPYFITKAELEIMLQQGIAGFVYSNASKLEKGLAALEKNVNNKNVIREKIISNFSVFSHLYC